MRLARFTLEDHAYGASRLPKTTVLQSKAFLALGGWQEEIRQKCMSKLDIFLNPSPLLGHGADLGEGGEVGGSVSLVEPGKLR